MAPEILNIVERDRKHIFEENPYHPGFYDEKARARRRSWKALTSACLALPRGTCALCSMCVSKPACVIGRGRRLRLQLGRSKPERGVPPTPPQVDSWALGCMAYELLVGRSPFAARNDDKIEDKIHTGAAKQ